MSAIHYYPEECKEKLNQEKIRRRSRFQRLSNPGISNEESKFINLNEHQDISALARGAQTEEKHNSAIPQKKMRRKKTLNNASLRKRKFKSRLSRMSRKSALNQSTPLKPLNINDESNEQLIGIANHLLYVNDMENKEEVKNDPESMTRKLLEEDKQFEVLEDYNRKLSIEPSHVKDSAFSIMQTRKNDQQFKSEVADSKMTHRITPINAFEHKFYTNSDDEEADALNTVSRQRRMLKEDIKEDFDDIDDKKEHSSVKEKSENLEIHDI